MTVQLDLTRDLPKVREQLPQVMAALSRHKCDYTAPCVVGAMVPPLERVTLENYSFTDTSIGYLIRKRAVTVPKGQGRSFGDLQRAFDSGDRDHFERVLKRMEAKYLAGEQS